MVSRFVLANELYIEVMNQLGIAMTLLTAMHLPDLGEIRKLLTLTDLRTIESTNSPSLYFDAPGVHMDKARQLKSTLGLALLPDRGSVRVVKSQEPVSTMVRQSSVMVAVHLSQCLSRKGSGRSNSCPRAPDDRLAIRTLAPSQG